MNDTAANLVGKFDKIFATMTAANNRTVPVDGTRAINFSLKNVTRQILTKHIKSLDYDCILGVDLLKSFGMTVNFSEGICSLPGGESWKVDFPDSSEGYVSVIDSISAVDSTDGSRFFLDLTIKGEINQNLFGT